MVGTDVPNMSLVADPENGGRFRIVLEQDGAPAASTGRTVRCSVSAQRFRSYVQLLVASVVNQFDVGILDRAVTQAINDLHCKGAVHGSVGV